jgi:N-acetylglucosaminyl-diphospho-decaprenol L-rhamnosyltransferase
VILSAVIVNYRTPDLTGQVVTALLPELEPLGEFRVYVVDNASGDDSVERLRARALADGWGDRVEVVAAPKNGGYGYGINVAVKAARAYREPSDYIFVLNSDAFADEGTPRRMVGYMEAHPDVGVVGGNIRGTDGSAQASAFRFPTLASELNVTAKTGVLSRLLGNPVVALPLPDGPGEVEWISGTCMLIRTAVFEQVGLFDEGFFLYFEEVDFCRRARGAGWKSVCLPQATVTHLGSASTGMGDNTRPMPRYWFESRRRYFVKHHSPRYAAASDVSWASGFLLGELKRHVLRRPSWSPPHMFRDFVRYSLGSLIKGSTVVPAGVEAGSGTGISSGTDTTTAPPADQRPPEALGALEILAEDFATFDRDLSQPGFWAVAAHRLGRRAAAAHTLPARVALQATYKALFTTVDWVWGIHLPRTVELGRRVRIWHNGCMLLVARSIGNDVHLRHDTTFGPLRGAAGAPEDLPVIEDRADIGSGVCVLGAVSVGHDAVVGANSVVLKNVQPNTTVLGVPARMVPA